MARGNPDYKVFSTQTSIYTTETELIKPYDTGFARLDSGGRIVWYENFANGLYRYNKIATGNGETPVITMENNRCYGFNPSCRLDPIAHTGQSLIQAQPRLSLSGKIGIEVCYYVPQNHGEINIILAPVIGAGTFSGYFLRHDPTTGYFYVYTGGVYVAVYSPSEVSYFYDKFIAIKLVIDFDNSKYDTLLLGDERIYLNLAGRPNYVGGDGGSAFHSLECKSAGATLIEPAHFSYVIITADEQ